MIIYTEKGQPLRNGIQALDMTKYVRSQPIIAASVKVQNHDSAVIFSIQRYTAYRGFVIYRNDDGTGLIRCSRTIYKEVPRALNALWIEIGKHIEDCYKGGVTDHSVSMEIFETA